ncbi:MAG TPA: ABC-three component system middle component 8 [Negativicutes bacterium]|nr:ABC-three component system middle component 8 [Negativicutes bacterium]
MLRPTKHSHPDRTVINVSLLLLARLKTCRVDEYDVLRKFVKKRIVGGDVLFLPALNFLYLMGLVEYLPKTDSVEYVGPNETV